MSTVGHIQEAPQSGSGRMLRAMVGIGTVCALLIVLTYEGTAERIATLQDKALEAAVFRVLPGTTSTAVFTVMASGDIKPAEEGSSNLVYAGYNDEGKLTGVAIEASGQGYAGVIRILYGYDPDTETVVGFYVLQSNETPGLGDKIEKDEDFLANFDGLDVRLENGQLRNQVVPVKNGTKTNAWEVDAITGATISSRAIAEIIDRSAGEILPVIVDNRSVFDKKP